MPAYSGQLSFRKRLKRQLKSVGRGRRLRFELLESRRVLAEATLVTHTFREDDFSIAGDFTYHLHEPDEYDYIDAINNGRYTSSDGHVEWISATEGQAFFEGTATGDGRDTVDFAGRRNCSEYGIEEKGRLDFTVDAEKSTLIMDVTEEFSTRYTYYRDLTGGYCERPDPPWSRFFGGITRLYTGTFSPATHKVSVHYDQMNPEITVNSPLTDVIWANTDATDLELTAAPIQSTPEVPDGFVGIEQTSPPPATFDSVDVQNGGLEFTVDLSGKPLRTSTPLTPVATVRAFWASSASDTAGTEIPLHSATDPVGLFWNSSQLQATITQFPVPPPTAKFIRVTVDAPESVDADPLNSTRYLPIGEFQARDSTGNSVSEDASYDGSTESVLHPLDRSDSSVKVLAYRPESDMGAFIEVIDDTGAFYYDPTFTEAIQALGVGETVNDMVRFVAVKNQTLLDEATLTIPVRGENDLPFADDDFATATNFHPLTILPSALLANDSDPDHTDSITLQSVDESSSWGAAIEVVFNEAQTEILQIIYDPSVSPTLRGLATGEKIDDSFLYEIVDRHGAVTSGFVVIEVTGEERVLAIVPLDSQYTTTGVATGSILVSIEDPDGDPSDIQVTAAAQDAGLVPPSGIEIVNTNGIFYLTITPAPAVNGRTSITLTAGDGGAHTANTSFLLVVGTETDLDLDGVPDDVEDASPNGGDMNQDGLADSRQAHVAAVRTRQGDSFLSLVAPEENVLIHVFTEGSPAPAGPASDAQFPIGLLRFELLAESSGALSTLTIRTDYSATSLNRVFQFDGEIGQAAESETSGGQGWTSLMYNKRNGARLFADRVVVSLQDGGRGDANAVADGLIRSSIAFGHVAHPWQNLVREDVDNDGIVAPIDVLLLINQLNDFGARGLGAFPTGNESLPNFLDPSGSDSLEPIDVLIVINFLNNRTVGTEGESTATADPDGVTSAFTLIAPLAVRTDWQTDDSARERIAHSHREGGEELRRFPANSQPALNLRRSTTGSTRARTSSLRYAADLDAILAQEESFDALGLCPMRS